jgi:DNA-binding response OmpR family regulator
MKILVIDDDPSFTGLVEAYLRKEGHQTVSAPTGAEGLEKTRSFQPDVILLDIVLQRESGLHLIPDLLMERAEAAVIMLTGYPSTQSVIEAMNQGAVHYLEKPVDFAKLGALLKSGLPALPSK